MAKAISALKRAKASKQVSSYKVFIEFVKYDEKNACNATRITSKSCYKRWRDSRKVNPKNPKEAFRRALTAHLRGVDGRRPFPKEVEASLLTVVRKKEVWACFQGLKERCVIGVQGFPSLGYHEKTREDTLKIILSFVKYEEDGSCDASRIISKECFNKWKQSNLYTVANNHEEIFQDVITNATTGLKGYKPFDKEIESSLLQSLRRKNVWECFQDISDCFIGLEGFSLLGYHERKEASLNLTYVSDVKAESIRNPANVVKFEYQYGMDDRKCSKKRPREEYFNNINKFERFSDFEVYPQYPTFGYASFGKGRNESFTSSTDLADFLFSPVKKQKSFDMAPRRSISFSSAADLLGVLDCTADDLLTELELDTTTPFNFVDGLCF